jgi:Rrf2 family protein
VQVSARVDYAVRALVVLATSATRLTRDEIATAQQIPPRYLEDVLGELRRTGFVDSQRGNAGGYRLALDPAQVSVAAVARAIDGPLALVQGERPGAVAYPAPCAPVGDVWVALRAAIRSVMERVTIADLASPERPAAISALLDDPSAWEAH